MDIVQQLCLGIALASATGLRAFLPLLILAATAHFGYIHLNSQFSWVGSTSALVILGTATLAELLSDKIPVVDHALDAVSTVVRPVAGTLALASTQTHFDPTTAALIGLMVGAPLAGSLHVAKGGTRLASTAFTGGLANPVLSIAEDIASLGLSFAAIFAPILGLILAMILLAVGWRFWKRARRLKSQL